jgi:hypothetical protein
MEPNIVRLTYVPYTFITFHILLADVGSAVGRSVIRNEQFEVLVTLAEECLY